MKNNPTFRDELKKEMKWLIDNVLTLYKYVPFDGCKYILKNSSLLIRNPTEFNDPYDCHTGLISYSKIPDDYIRYLVNKKFPHLSRAERRKKAIIEIKTGKHKFTELGKNQIQKEKAIRGITCFTEDFKNLLMWSMYANSHKGVCIGFDLKKLYNSIHQNQYDEKVILKVKYTDEFESVNFFEDGFKAIINWLRTKSLDWEYEKEIRVMFAPIQSPEIDEFISFSKDCVNEIYLGSKMNKKEEKEIKDIIMASYPHVKLQKMRLSQNSFELINTTLLD